MKIKLLSLLTLLTLMASCGDINDPPIKISECKFTDNRDVIITDIELKAPDGMSNAFYSGIGSDKIIRSLTHAMWSGNFSTVNRAKINGRLTSSGKTCTGENIYTYKADNNRIGGNYLNLDLPAGVNFLGSISMEIRSDDYKNSNSTAEYVLWVGSGNDPDFNGVSGKILGSRQVYNPTSSRLRVIHEIGEDPSIVISGERRFLEEIR